MPNTLDTNGLTTKTLAEILSDLVTQMQTIFGTDINVNSNSPDGQLLNIFAQVTIDMLEVLTNVYNSFGIDTAYGVQLDQRVALNGVTRNQGTYTIQNVLVTASQAVTLTGLDALIANPNASVFTVSDNTGNQFQLITTYSFAGAGSQSLAFQSAVIGAVLTTQNTITNQVTITSGITSVNNPTVATQTGVNEETDAALKIRHAKMFLLASICPADSVRAAMLAVSGCIDAYVVENTTNGTVNSVPAHSIWCIANGGTDKDIATAIYMKKSAGCGMFGSSTYAITRPAGNSMTISFDRALTQNLYIHFSIVAINGTDNFDNTAVKNSLVAALIYKLGQRANIGGVISAMLAIAPNGYLTGVGVSTDNISFTDAVTTSDSQHYFVVLATNITII
jgi:uncharacterized phage protein gp47/JayE